MTLRIFLASFVLSLSSLASAAQITKTAINGVTLSYSAATQKVYATGTLISGTITRNSLSDVSVNSEITAKLEVDKKGGVYLVRENSVPVLVGQVQKDMSVVLGLPYQTFQITETYDMIEKSFGLVDVEYIALDLQF